MKDYRVIITIKNNHLWRAMQRAGFTTAAELSRASGVRQDRIGLLLNLKMSPTTRTGEIRPIVARLSSVLGVIPEGNYILYSLTEKG